MRGCAFRACTVVSGLQQKDIFAKKTCLLVLVSIHWQAKLLEGSFK